MLAPFYLTFGCRYDITPAQATRLFDMLDPLGQGRIAKGDILKHVLPLIRRVECFGPTENGPRERRSSAFKASICFMPVGTGKKNVLGRKLWQGAWFQRNKFCLSYDRVCNSATASRGLMECRFVRLSYLSIFSRVSLNLSLIHI